MEPSTGHQLMDYIVALAVCFIGMGKGFTLMKDWGWFPARNGHDGLKRFGDLTVETADGKVRHAIRGELQPLTLLQTETNRRLEGLNVVLVEIRTILEQQK